MVLTPGVSVSGGDRLRGPAQAFNVKGDPIGDNEALKRAPRVPSPTARSDPATSHRSAVMNLVEAYDATHTPRLPTEAPPLSDAADDERSVVDERATSSPPIGGGVPMLLEVPQRACGAPSPSKVADGAIRPRYFP